MARIALVNPTFDKSFWGFDHIMGISGKKAIVPFAALPLLASLTPAQHEVRLFDERVAPLDYDELARFDMVGLTGLCVQRHRMLEIAKELKARGVFLVIGGAWITVQEDYFDGLADVTFVGEADQTWPVFLEQWARGEQELRYEQEERTDMSTLPVPRRELLQADAYMFGSLQISRGCPYRCEFCDIIVTFGRRPRLKGPEQVVAELEDLHAQGFTGCFIVDDNLIGNRKLLRPVLEAVVEWQRAREYPIKFFTEASLDLAEDEDLMKLLVDANVQAVFVGIESPNEEALVGTKKLQNVSHQRRPRTIVQRVNAIQDAGMEVWCGLIVGFDEDDESIFEAQVRMLEEADIPWAMIGMLAAIPKTPLYDRLDEEGRLDHDDQPAFGTNVHPKKMSREALSDGYTRLLLEAYHPDSYFKRVDHLHIDRRHDHGIPQRERYLRRRTRMSRNAKTVVKSAVALQRLLSVAEPDMARVYKRQVAKMVASRPHPKLLSSYIFKCVAHHHHWRLSQEIAQGPVVVNSY